MDSGLGSIVLHGRLLSPRLVPINVDRSERLGCMPAVAFPGSVVPTLSHSSYLMFGLLQCGLYGTVLEEHSDASTGEGCSTEGSLWGPWVAHIIQLFLFIHWLLVYFQVKLKVLVITYETLHGIGPSYLRNYLTLMGLA